MPSAAFGVIEDARARQRRRRVAGVALIACAGLAAAQLADRSGEPTPSATAPGVAGGGSPAALLAKPGRRWAILSCRQAVYGQLAANWRARAAGSIVAGPVVWPYLRAAARAEPSGTYRLWNGLAPAQKALVVVRPGTAARVVIPPDERTRISLDYSYLPGGRGPGGIYLGVADGASEVTFRACAPGPGVTATQFAGAFIVGGAQCARVDVYARPGAAPLVRRIPFGVPARSCGSGA